MSEKGLVRLPLPVKVFIICYMVLTTIGLLLSLWIVLRPPLRGAGGAREGYISSLEESGDYAPAEIVKEGLFRENLRLAHIHHLGHIFMVFSVAGIYAFIREKESLKLQIIVWTTISTLVHTLAFLINSKVLLFVFGGVYGLLLAYMMFMIVIDCFRPVREQLDEE